MSTTELIDLIKKLPDDKQKEVEDFVDFLIAKSNTEISKHKNSDIKIGFGGGKGIFGKMADDFNEPLDDMKEYM